MGIEPLPAEDRLLRLNPLNGHAAIASDVWAGDFPHGEDSFGTWRRFPTLTADRRLVQNTPGPRFHDTLGEPRMTPLSRCWLPENLPVPTLTL